MQRKLAGESLTLVRMIVSSYRTVHAHLTFFSFCFTQSLICSFSKADDIACSASGCSGHNRHKAVQRTPAARVQPQLVWSTSPDLRRETGGRGGCLPGFTDLFYFICTIIKLTQ